VVRAIHTPGHRPEHTAFVLIDTSRGPEPWAVLTGDTLFVGDIARPDLAIEKSAGARGIFRSLHERLLTLPDACEVWPAHLGGSMCGGPGMDMKVSSTIGYERAHNELLSETDEQRFVERALAKLGPQPPNFEAIVELNRGPLLTEGVETLPLTPRQLEQKRLAGALVVDVRTDLQFDEAHIPGALCIPALRAGFGTRLAWLVGRHQQIVLVGRDDEDARGAVRLAVAVGMRKAGGYLAGGMTSWRQEKREVERIERMEADELAARLEAAPETQVLDVRERPEWEAGHIPGSLFCPWHDIDRLPEGVDRDRPVAVLCSSGERAAVAASLVKRQGARSVIHVVSGGVPRWRELGHPVEQPAAVSHAG
jgi:rhodanese-related sulfurtransferase